MFLCYQAHSRNASMYLLIFCQATYLYILYNKPLISNTLSKKKNLQNYCHSHSKLWKSTNTSTKKILHLLNSIIKICPKTLCYIKSMLLSSCLVLISTHELTVIHILFHRLIELSIAQHSIKRRKTVVSLSLLPLHDCLLLSFPMLALNFSLFLLDTLPCNPYSFGRFC